MPARGRAWTGVELNLPGVSPGHFGLLQVRGWLNDKGTLTSYEAALAAGAAAGKSTLFWSIPQGDPPMPSPNIVGNSWPMNNLQPLSLVPEPSALALGMFGAVALSLCRRRT